MSDKMTYRRALEARLNKMPVVHHAAPAAPTPSLTAPPEILRVPATKPH
jgi:hypothetical protein